MAVAAKEGQNDAADLDDGQKRNGQFGDHGHVEPHGIPLAQPQPAQGVGAPVHFALQFGVGEGPRRAFFPFPAQRDLIGHRRREPFVQAVIDDVQFTAHTPTWKFDAGAQVHDLAVGLAKTDVQVGHHRVPEPTDIGLGPCVEVYVVGNMVTIHEALEIALRDPGRIRLPGDRLVKGKGGGAG